MTGPRQFTLGSDERLKSRKLIDRLFKEGKGFTVFPFRLLYLFVDDAPFPLQAGVTASSRNFKKAVDRNRIKRLTREAYRLQKNELTALLSVTNKKLAVFFIYTGKEIPDYKTVEEKVSTALGRLISVVNEHTSQNT